MRNFTLAILFILMINFVNAEIIWQDDFETDTGWILADEFEIGAPQGQGGNYGNADPDSAYSGNNVLGVDLSGTGEFPFDYEPNLQDRECYAISPEIDCSLYQNVQMSFQLYLNLEQNAYDNGYIDISIDGGSSWTEVWHNDDTIEDTDWAETNFDLSGWADGYSSVQIRFSVGTTDGSWQYSGWNIDDIVFTGDVTNIGYLEGFILDDLSDEPIENVTISYQNLSITTDSLGFFSMILPTGNFNVNMHHQYYYDRNFFVNIADDDTLTIQTTLNYADQIESFSANVHEINSVILSWEAPEDTQEAIVLYSIFRDGGLIASTAETSFIDENLTPGIYSYNIVIYYTNTSTLPTDDIFVEIIGCEIDSPIDFTATSNDDNSVVLSWQNPHPGYVSGYNFYRNSEFVTEISADSLTYQTEILPDGTYTLGLSAIYGSYESEIVEYQIEIVDNQQDVDSLLKDKLYSAYPNPFNPKTNISFSLQKDAEVDITIYNILGQKIKQLTHKYYQSGKHNIVWEGKDNSGKSVSSGTYFYQMKIDNQLFKTDKCLLLK